jgi:hypothetical protein
MILRICNSYFFGKKNFSSGTNTAGAAAVSVFATGAAACCGAVVVG